MGYIAVSIIDNSNPHHHFAWTNIDIFYGLDKMKRIWITLIYF